MQTMLCCPWSLHDGDMFFLSPRERERKWQDVIEGRITFREDAWEERVVGESSQNRRKRKTENILPLLGYCTFRCSASSITFFQLPSSRFRSISDSIRRVWPFLLVIVIYGWVRVSWQPGPQSAAIYWSSVILFGTRSPRTVMTVARGHLIWTYICTFVCIYVYICMTAAAYLSADTCA